MASHRHRFQQGGKMNLKSAFGVARVALFLTSVLISACGQSDGPMTAEEQAVAQRTREAVASLSHAAPTTPAAVDGDMTLAAESAAEHQVTLVPPEIGVPLMCSYQGACAGCCHYIAPRGGYCCGMC